MRTQIRLVATRGGNKGTPLVTSSVLCALTCLYCRSAAMPSSQEVTWRAGFGTTSYSHTRPKVLDRTLFLSVLYS